MRRAPSAIVTERERERGGRERGERERKRGECRGK